MKVKDILLEQDAGSEISGPATNRLAGAISQGAATGVGQSAAVTSGSAVSLNFGSDVGAFSYQKTPGGGWIETSTKSRTNPRAQLLMDLLASKDLTGLSKKDGVWVDDNNKYMPINARLSATIDEVLPPQPADAAEPEAASAPQSDLHPDVKVMNAASPVVLRYRNQDYALSADDRTWVKFGSNKPASPEMTKFLRNQAGKL